MSEKPQKPRWRREVESLLWLYLYFALPVGVIGGVMFYVADHITIGWR